MECVMSAVDNKHFSDLGALSPHRTTTLRVTVTMDLCTTHYVVA